MYRSSTARSPAVPRHASVPDSLGRSHVLVRRLLLFHPGDLLINASSMRCAIELGWLVPPLSDRSRRRTWAGFGHAILPAWFATLPRSTTAAAAAAAAAATRTAAEGASAVGLGPGLVNIEGAPIQLGAVQGGDSAIGLGAVRHLDKREAARAARIAVGNQVDPLHVPVRLKSARMEDSVAAKSKLPTKMFFILKVPSYLTVRARDEADGLRPRL